MLYCVGNMSKELSNKYRGCLVGLAVGDALGVPLEFQTRDTNPRVTEILGGGPFYLKPGEWTDDTSMALCLGQSLLDCNGFDPKDQMDKYWKWLQDGYMSSTGAMFDVGETTADSLCRYRKTGNPYAGLHEEYANANLNRAGNGSLMRLAPIPMFYKNKPDNPFLADYSDANLYACGSSHTTHGSEDCVHSCAVFSVMLYKALHGVSKSEILDGDEKTWQHPPYSGAIALTPKVRDIAKGTYKKKIRDEIKSSGYVVHTLEAALWSFYNTDNFEDGAVAAVNLADDSDTTGAVYGQIAGAYYGYDAIPKRWLDKIVKLDLILEMADKLYEKNNVLHSV
jgi:ADP-ribosyl-[dinitrogen reductase] hydrolase